MAPATTSIRIAKNAKSFWPSTILLRLEPPKCTNNAGSRKNAGAAPVHLSGAPVGDEIGRCIDCPRQGTGPDGNVRIRHANQVDHQRDGKNITSASAAAAAAEPERKPDQ